MLFKWTRALRTIRCEAIDWLAGWLGGWLVGVAMRLVYIVEGSRALCACVRACRPQQFYRDGNRDPASETSVRTFDDDAKVSNGGCRIDL